MAPKSAVTSPVQKSPPCHFPSASDLEEQLSNLAVQCQPQEHAEAEKIELKTSRKSSTVTVADQQPNSSKAEESRDDGVFSQSMVQESFVLSQPPVPRRRQASEGMENQRERASTSELLRATSKTLPLPPKSQLNQDLSKRASPCPSTSSSIVDELPPQVPPRRSSREYGSQNLYHQTTGPTVDNRSPSPRSPAVLKTQNGENIAPPRPPKPPGMSRFPSLASVRSPLPAMEEEGDQKAPPLPPKPSQKRKTSEMKVKVVDQIYDAPPLPPKPALKLK
ncbi:unnamed protein product [Bursaphelenchus xylophilus]|nr:unnamed protein product [Bursaphelenchus xylophilus]CAG9126116.1 unnamed protein product [Bursaphelenchus xylophilus]